MYGIHVPGCFNNEPGGLTLLAGVISDHFVSDLEVHVVVVVVIAVVVVLVVIYFTFHLDLNGVKNPFNLLSISI